MQVYNEMKCILWNLVFNESLQKPKISLRRISAVLYLIECLNALSHPCGSVPFENVPLKESVNCKGIIESGHETV